MNRNVHQITWNSFCEVDCHAGVFLELRHHTVPKGHFLNLG